MNFAITFSLVILLCGAECEAAVAPTPDDTQRQSVALSGQRVAETLALYAKLSARGFRGEAIIQWRYATSRCIAEICDSPPNPELSRVMGVLARNSPSIFSEIGSSQAEDVASIMTILLNISGYLSVYPAAVDADDGFIVATAALKGVELLEHMVIPNYSPVAVPLPLPEPPGLSFVLTEQSLDQITDLELRTKYRLHIEATKRIQSNNAIQRMLKSGILPIRHNVLRFSECMTKELRARADASVVSSERERFYAYAVSIRLLMPVK